MRLTRLFMLTTGVLLTLVTIMALRSAFVEWHTVDTTARGVRAMEVAQLAMIIAEKASFERGPSNVVMGDTEPPDPAKRKRMLDARQASDEAITALTRALAGSTSAAHAAALAQVEKTRTALMLARAEIERVAALPFGERSGENKNVIRVPVGKMFGVIDIALETVTLLSTDAEMIFPDLAHSLVGARQAAELREYAGRIGSQLTTPIGANSPLGPEEKRDIPVLEGRINQLRQLIEVGARANATDPRVIQAIGDMRARYFESGLPLINRLTEAGAAGNDYGMDLATFVARYVPEMGFIVKLRDVKFEVARGGALKRHEQARRNLFISLAIGLTILLIEITVFLLIRRRVLKPLLAGTSGLVAIAQGQLDAPQTLLSAVQRSDEIGDMQRAIVSLRQTSLDKQQLEAEREQLIEKLQVLSSTDSLTALLNRRAFTERVTHQLAIARRNHWPVALVMFDIDHFKAINDQYGHAVGDQVLARVAAAAQTETRAADLLARHGGEEFIALLVNCDEQAAFNFADRVRQAITTLPLTSVNGASFKITASFGVTSAPANEVADLDEFIQRTDRSLYRAKADGRNRVVASSIL